jgi:UDP-N-acetylmuramoyl-L-alanyl-D-glutamate--2,6-diaminopimelate ligase
MRLSELLHILPDYKALGEVPGGELSGLAYDSRKAGPGVFFAALIGVHADGHDYVKAAAEAGALAALVEKPVEEAAICQIQVPDSRAALSLLAHRFYGEPSKELCCMALTGTNGKTTTSYLIEAMLKPLGPVGVIGTVDTRFMGCSIPAKMTTPESVDLMASLAEMHRAGVKNTVMEISSHALEQHRADGMQLDAALFTNLSRDHLDYHGDMQSYFQAKARLFTELAASFPSPRQKGAGNLRLG